MYHGYPEDTIPTSCSYKIGNEAVDTVYDVPTVVRPVQQPAPEDVQFSERELIHIDSILTLHAIEHLPKGCNCPECISIHKKIAELRKSGKQGGKRE
jgi:hypothetical protein